jgi:hypothetical protein
VPAEPARLRRTLQGRDRRFLAIVAAAALLGIPATLVLADRHAKPPIGCARRLERGFMGGQTVTICRRASPQPLEREVGLDGSGAAHQTRQSDARRDERSDPFSFVRRAHRIALVGIPLRQAD